MNFIKIAELENCYLLEEDDLSALSEKQEYSENNTYICEYILKSNFPISRIFMLKGGGEEFKFDNNELEFTVDGKSRTTLFKVIFKPEAEGDKKFELIIKTIGREKELSLLKRVLKVKKSNSELNPLLIEDDSKSLKNDMDYLIGKKYEAIYMLESNFSSERKLSLIPNGKLMFNSVGSHAFNIIIRDGLRRTLFKVVFNPLVKGDTKFELFIRETERQKMIPLLKRILKVKSSPGKQTKNDT
ncbi:MAG: hypothetical protein O7C59_00300 [Rickettsia endosymbiont of Ixodes persulcatus]|nr:hypothetical protein [Rickettsia endosymbiont of Ixodes persulcatus]